MRQILPVICILLLLSCCKNSSQTENSNENEKGWNYKEVNSTYLDSLRRDICATPDLEFIDLYSILDSIASDQDEELYLLNALKSQGFEITNWGRGNWMSGPRIVSATLTNNYCECAVDKLYYSTKQEGKYKVTERIKCKKKM